MILRKGNKLKEGRRQQTGMLFHHLVESKGRIREIALCILRNQGYTAIDPSPAFQKGKSADEGTCPKSPALNLNTH